MPIYEYKCHQCGQKFEVRQRISEEPLKTHEGCGGEVEKLISLSALHFKGKGWYVTDYGKGGQIPPASASNGQSESKTDTPSESKSDTKTETKTESKSESKPESKSESKSEPSPAAK
jgi:putative FmdB family regulatory protein